MVGLTEASRDKCLQAIVESVTFGLKHSPPITEAKLEDAITLQTEVQRARQNPSEVWRRVMLLVARACRKHGELDRVLPRVRRGRRHGGGAEGRAFRLSILGQASVVACAF